MISNIKLPMFRTLGYAVTMKTLIGTIILTTLIIALLLPVSPIGVGLLGGLCWFFEFSTLLYTLISSVPQATFIRLQGWLGTIGDLFTPAEQGFWQSMDSSYLASGNYLKPEDISWLAAVIKP
ncbi:MAG: hypothetical protein ACK4PR_12265, partial [Gammaproteobacteria bacterium]